MWDTLLPAVLRMSFTGSIAIFIVIFARILLHRTPKIFSYLLWGVVLLRLLCPVSLQAYLSVMPLADVPAQTGEHIKHSLQNLAQHQDIHKNVPDASMDGSYVQNPAVSGQSGAEYIIKKVLYPGTAVWLAGAVAVFIYNILSLLLLRRRLIGAVKLRDNIYLADYIPSAFVIGLLRPRIYLPAMLSEQEQEYIIMHEQVHIRRKDYLVRILALIALGIHWFNPLVWLAFRLSEKDMEISCDEAVVKRMDHDIRAEYSASLLKMAAGRRILSGTLAAFGEGETKSRIKHILYYKKPAVVTILAAVVIMAVTIVIAGSSPQKQKNSKSHASENISGKDTKTDPETGQPVIDENNKYAKSVYAVKWKSFTDLGINDDFAHTMECAFFLSMTEDTIVADPAEYIDEDTDPERLKELGITMEYLKSMDGYELNNPEKDTVTWKIDENTEFIFLDWGRDFIKEEIPCESITVKTKDRELFRCYLSTYKNSKPGMPFFFEVEDGVIKRIFEKFFA